MTWLHTFSPAKMWIGGLSILNKPLLQFHTQFNAQIPWKNDGYGLYEPKPYRTRWP